MKVILTYFCFILFAFTLNFTLNGQPYQNPSRLDSIEKANIASKLDDMLTLWHNTKFSNTGHYYETKTSFAPDVIPTYPDSIYIQRLIKLNSPIPLVFNAHVRNFIELYLMQKRQSVAAMIGLSVYYFPIFEEELDKNKMPLELKYLPIIESALNTYAVSRAGASGIWQFMYQTGKIYGLNITSYVDERRDPYMATKAAIAYLKDMYEIYHDWLLVVASYNCGAGNVNRAIRRSGNSTNFWDIYPYLPSETRGYVPAFIAANYVMNYYKEHNVFPTTFFNPGLTDTVISDRNISYSVLSKVLNIPVEKIRLYNPQYHRDVLPKSSIETKYILRLPISDASLFETKRAQIYTIQDTLDYTFNQRYVVNSKPVQNQTIKNGNTQYSLLYYKVKSGDYLGMISTLYNCDIYDVKKWNGIKGFNVSTGRILKIYVPSYEVDEYRNVNYLSYEQKLSIIQNKGRVNDQAATNDTQKVANQNAPPQNNNKQSNQSQVNNTTNNQSEPQTKYLFYTIKPGDTLWSISQKFPGNTPNDLMALNNIAGTRSIQPGQKIKVKVNK